MDDKPVTRWLRTALWHSLHCYIGVFISFAALLGPYSIHCSRMRTYNWVEGSVGAVFVALIPAVVVGPISTFAPAKVWKWMRLIFVGLAVLFAISNLTAPASWWTC
jgi:hypothetical protein